MDTSRIYSIQSRNKIYHLPGCSYTKHMNVKYKRQKGYIKLEALGYRPCKHCNNMKHMLAFESKSINRFFNQERIKYYLKGDILYIGTKISCWKIMYGPTTKKFRIYHRNDTGLPLDFSKAEWETYHRQFDNPKADSLIEVFTYIERHDRFKKIEKESNGHVDIRKIDKKYRKAYIKKQKRKKNRRLDYLFKVIENDDKDFVKLSHN